MIWGTTCNVAQQPSNSSTVDQPIESGADSPTDLSNIAELTETSWYVGPTGYTQLTFAVTNTSAYDTGAAEVDAIGRDDDGAIVFSDTCVLPLPYPGQTAYLSQPGGNGVAPASVEFRIRTLASPAPKTRSCTPGSYLISNVNKVDGDYGTFFTGEIAVETIGDCAFPGVQFTSLCVTVVLRNEAGEIVFGTGTNVTMPAEGESVTFETPFELDLPDYTDIEVYALGW